MFERQRQDHLEPSLEGIMKITALLLPIVALVSGCETVACSLPTPNPPPAAAQFIAPDSWLVDYASAAFSVVHAAA